MRITNRSSAVPTPKGESITALKDFQRMIDRDLARCSGCSRCEVNCSFFHTGKVGRTTARIKVVKIEGTGIDFPLVCQQCKERYCTKCPESAICVGDLGQVLVAKPLCTACGVCETLCPIGAIEITDDIPHVCDLCGGDPRCVKACNLDAIFYEPGVSEAVSLKPFKKDAGALSPEEKRFRFAESHARELRKQWTGEGGR